MLARAMGAKSTLAVKLDKEAVDKANQEVEQACDSSVLLSADCVRDAKIQVLRKHASHTARASNFLVYFHAVI